MTDQEKQLIRACIGVMRQPRNRFGRIETDKHASNDLHLLVYSFGRLPHGGYDTIDKAQMLLSLMIGEEPVSIMDVGRSR